MICAAALTFVLSGCSIFQKYEDNTTAPDNLFGSEAVEYVQDNSIANIPWREFFEDPILVGIIDSALVRNTDLNVARLRVEEAEASLLASKLGFLPGLSFGPSFSFMKGQSYSLPLSLEWSSTGLGTITNTKREAQTRASQSVDAAQYVQSRMIASLVDAYYQLVLLDRELEIMTSTEEVWKDVYETQKALFENGKSYSTSVDQMAASLIDVVIRKRDISNEIKDVEYSICMMLNQTPQTIERCKWGDYSLPKTVELGFPATMLAKRPDVRAAAKDVEAAYYVKAQALGAMFPSLSLSGLLGWTTEGASIKDPAQMIYSAVVGLAQPIFARGQLSARYKISKLQQEEAARMYAQTVLDAGNEVNKALRSCQLAADKSQLYAKEVEVLGNAYSATRELMRNGKASYIEVLIAQDNLLNAQLSEVVNLYAGTIDLVSLYIALGGGAD